MPYREAMAKADAVEELFDLFDGFLKDKGSPAIAGQVIGEEGIFWRRPKVFPSHTVALKISISFFLNYPPL